MLGAQSVVSRDLAYSSIWIRYEKAVWTSLNLNEVIKKGPAVKFHLISSEVRSSFQIDTDTEAL